MANLAVPTPRTFTVGETEVGAYFNAVRDALNFLINIPIATVYQATAQTISPANTPVMLTFDATVVDSYGGHSNSTNNSEYIAQVAGWYLITGSVCFVASSSGTYRKVQAYHNGSPIPYGPSQLPPAGATYATSVPMVPAFIYMAVGDYVQIGATTDVASIATVISSQNNSSMTVFWLHA